MSCFELIFIFFLENQCKSNSFKFNYIESWISRNPTQIEPLTSLSKLIKKAKEKLRNCQTLLLKLLQSEWKQPHQIQTVLPQIHLQHNQKWSIERKTPWPIGSREPRHTSYGTQQGASSKEWTSHFGCSIQADKNYNWTSIQVQSFVYGFNIFNNFRLPKPPPLFFTASILDNIIFYPKEYTNEVNSNEKTWPIFFYWKRKGKHRKLIDTGFPIQAHHVPNPLVHLRVRRWNSLPAIILEQWVRNRR